MKSYSNTEVTLHISTVLFWCEGPCYTLHRGAQPVSSLWKINPCSNQKTQSTDPLPVTRGLKLWARQTFLLLPHTQPWYLRYFGHSGVNIVAKDNIPYACWDSNPKSLACSGSIHLLSWPLVITVLIIKKARSISTGLTGGQHLHFPL